MPGLTMSEPLWMPDRTVSNNGSKFIVEIEWVSRRWWPVKKRFKITRTFTNQPDALWWIDQAQNLDVYIFAPLMTVSLMEQEE